MALERVLGADPPDCLWARDGVLCGCRGEIQLAMQLAYERLKHVIEPSTAVALVPLFRQGNQFVSKGVGGMLTGSNGSGCGQATSGRDRNYAAIGDTLVIEPRV